MHSFFRKKNKPVIFVVSVLSVLTAGLVVAGIMAGSDNKGYAHESAYERYDSGFEIAEPGSYDSVDTAVIKNIDMDSGSVTFMNIETGKYYTLGYDGTTILQDKHGGGMAMTQMKDGDIVDVTFLRNKKKLTTMKLSESAWVMEDVQKYNFDLLSKSADIGGGVYSLRNNIVVYSEGEDAHLEDIVRGDVVSISGVGNNVYSVVVEEGHGYLRLSNDEYLKGGWIEVGQSVIQEITEDMLLVVPEGTYEVHLTASGIDEIKQVTIYRNQEMTLDVSDVEPEAPKMGKLVFALNPANAEVTIDGNKVDATQPVEVEYGIHEIVVTAEGYESLTQHIKVGQAMASLSITLEKDENADSDSKKDKDSTTTTKKDTTSTSEKDTDTSTKKDTSTVVKDTSTNYKVYIDAPVGVQVYLDGVYKGVTPVSFKKVAGKHTISLRKTGYVTKSYTIQLDNAKKDVTYSFAELVKEETKKDDDSGTTNTISGNVAKKKRTVSGNSSDEQTESEKK